MQGLKIENNDLVRDTNGRLVEIEGREYYIQRVKIKIKTILGEIPYDTSLGIDWFLIFETKVGADRILREINRVLLQDPETSSIENLELIEIDRSERKVKIQMVLISTYGKIPLSELISI
ncbi:MAG: DUF2634 domain-containing protein [Leptospira sp.]|nr:DUF2634 domain-containing protein [Leptospira sp.]